MKRFHEALAGAAAALCLLLSSQAFASCSIPPGVAGDVIYNSTYNVLQYCNGTNWVNTGSPSSPGGSMIAGDFCTSDGTRVSCTSPYTGSGNVVLSASPTITGTLVGASSTWSGNVSGNTSSWAASVSIGTTVASGALNVKGTATATSFSGSGAGLTGIGTSSLTGISGSPSSTTYLRGDGTWASISTGLPSLASGDIWVGNASSAATAVAPSGDITISNAGVTAVAKIAGVAVGTPTGTGNVVFSASPTLTGTVTAANANFSGQVTINADTYSNNYYHNSDRRLKDNIKTIAGLSLVERLNGVTFNLKKDGALSAGVIAQDVQAVLPEAVSVNKSSGLLSVSYDALIAPLIESIKELKGMFERLDDQVTPLFARLDQHDAEIEDIREDMKALHHDFDAYKAAHH